MKLQIFLDLDRTIGDTDSAIEDLIGEEDFELLLHRDQVVSNMLWKKVSDNPIFWDNIKPFPYASALYNKCIELCPDTFILSAYPGSFRGNDINICKLKKKEWVEKYFGTEQSSRVIVTASCEKHHYVDTDSPLLHVLIDDRADTIKLWNKFGGFGIVHRTFNDTMKALSFLSYACKKAKDARSFLEFLEKSGRL